MGCACRRINGIRRVNKMKVRNCYILTFVFLLTVSLTFAQRKRIAKQSPTPKQTIQYNNKEYLSTIKSVQLYNTAEEQSLPLLHLGSDEKLHLSFDDLRADHRTLYFSFEHCDANWKKSNLSSLEYSSGYGEDIIKDYSVSRNTLQKFTHYSVDFPTENTKPLLAGNYLLKIYEDGDKDRLILTRRFYVVSAKATIQAKVGTSLNVQSRSSHQRVELSLKTQDVSINNPFVDIKILVMQNYRPDKQIWLSKPTNIRGNELLYDNPNQINFKGGQEFLYVDLRSLQLESSMVKRMEIDTSTSIELWDDIYFDNLVYQETVDDNGRFYIRNTDVFEDSPLEGDYAEVTFSLKAPKTNDDIYLLGSFNNFDKTDENKMVFNETDQTWKLKKTLKQGVYDYLYDSSTAPSFYETKNSYQLFVYYRNPNFNRDELIGFQEINSN